MGVVVSVRPFLTGYRRSSAFCQPDPTASSLRAEGSVVLLLVVVPTTEATEKVGGRFMQRYHMSGAPLVRFCSALAVTLPTVLSIDGARAEQPPSPCHQNPNA